MRGRRSEIGDTRIADNGYHYTRVERGWRLTHHIVAEESLRRPLAPNERVIFIDGNKTNLDPDNLEVRQSQSTRQPRPPTNSVAVGSDLRWCGKGQHNVHFTQFYYKKSDPTQSGNKQVVCKACRIEYLAAQRV